MIVKHDSISPIDFEGLEIYDYTAGQKSRSSLAVIDVPPGARHPEAWSKRSDKYYYVVDGQIQFVLNGEKHTLQARDFVLVPQGQRFAYANETREHATLILVHTPNFDMACEVFV